MKMLNPCACADMILDEAKLLCWMLANELNDVLTSGVIPGEVITQLSTMLQHVTQLMIGRGHCAKWVAEQLASALERIEEHGVRLELGDAIARFVALTNEPVRTPQLTLIRDASVTVEEKAYLNERA
ncbi:MAG TPA: hypothetical protein DCR58_02040 [Idiomarina baltica]|nr:hypothetical protein [Alteromonas australica]HAR55547.1 hypothetical protein [Idiomarina baltica]